VSSLGTVSRKPKGESVGLRVASDRQIKIINKEQK
jgi:hypothetical protein